jgi:sugar phosphate isomerase/epimerase
MTVRETGLKGDHDAAAVRIVQDIADQAHTSGVRVALYPHAGFYVATAVDAARVARKAQRPNVGASLNLCHEFLSHQGGRLEATISQTASALLLVSVNGVELATKQYILRLDQGDFDVAAFLKKLQAAGYKGPVGLQCYGIKGNPEENLAASMAAWRRIAAQLEAVR